VGLASARAGNVIGGGDWAADRLIPDAVRALSARRPLDIRRPDAVRPWQHVLDPLHGYMLLAEALWEEPELGPAYNFGPDPRATATVREILELSRGHFDISSVNWGDGSDGPHEAGLLTLNSSKAALDLGFKPRFALSDTVERTWRWYRALAEGQQAADLCLADLIAYEAGKLDLAKRASA
jgi:CDP-glucose 4,6-dehydratase